MAKKKFVGTINLQPTWSSLLTTYLAIYRDAERQEARDMVLAELRRMAAAADRAVEMSKEAAL